MPNLDKKTLSERDICTKFITPALVMAGIPRVEGWQSETRRRQRRGVSKAAGTSASHIESAALGRTGQTSHYQGSPTGELDTG